MMKHDKHIHKPIKARSQTAPFSGPILSATRNPAADGGTTQSDYCKCGATRRMNLAGDNIERGAWEGGKPNYQDQRNPAAVALGRLGGKTMSPKRLEALQKNRMHAGRPRGPQYENVKEEVQVGIYNGFPLIRQLIRCESPSKRVSWVVRWVADGELVKVEYPKTNKKPIFEKEEGSNGAAGQGSDLIHTK